MIGIADGLVYVREKIPGFVHADLKPENVLINESGTAKITDLGLSHIAKSDKRFDGRSPDTPHLIDATTAGTGVSVGGGTPLYMAPEQITLGRAQPESDVYAIGCIAHELATGTPAYGLPSTPADYLLRHLYRQPLRLEAVRTGTPPAFAELVATMLAKAPQARPSLVEVRDTLRAIAAKLGIRLPFPEAAPAESHMRLTAAWGLLNLGLHSEGRRAAQQLLTENITQDDELRAHILIARSYNEAGDSEAADAELSRAAALLNGDTPSGPRVNYYTERLAAASSLGDDPAALRYAHQAIEAEPGASAGYGNLAAVYERLGDPEAAITNARKALSIAGNFLYYAQLNRLLWSAGEGVEALVVCDLMVASHPTLADAYALRGITRALVADAAAPLSPEAAQFLRAMLISDLKSALRYGPSNLPRTEVLHLIVTELG